MADPTAIADALNRMWARFLPDIEERVAVLEQAAIEVSKGSLTPELRTEASSAAHKLAGVLGTFGWEEGTVLAREAESLYAHQSDGTLLDARPALLAARLRVILASRSQ